MTTPTILSLRQLIKQTNGLTSRRVKLFINLSPLALTYLSLNFIIFMMYVTQRFTISGWFFIFCSHSFHKLFTFMCFISLCSTINYIQKLINNSSSSISSKDWSFLKSFIKLAVCALSASKTLRFASCLHMLIKHSCSFYN